MRQMRKKRRVSRERRQERRGFLLLVILFYFRASSHLVSVCAPWWPCPKNTLGGQWGLRKAAMPRDEGSHGHHPWEALR